VEDARERVAAGSLDLFPPFVDTTTWDERPIARERPYGSSVVVWRPTDAGREYLLLHRTAAGPPEYEGDWAWTPPSGARQPGELLEDGARRELREEAGLDLPLVETGLGTEEWHVYAAEAPADVEVVLDPEHDRFRWVSAEEAARICLPPMVGRSVAAVEAWLGSRS
jgi:8-oxo-dGTP pyrophosphatase MutT (NUDIX family)